jgi:putative transposase
MGGHGKWVSNDGQYTADFKFQVVLEAIHGNKTVSQIASEYSVHPHPRGYWKHQLLDDGPKVFAERPNRQARDAVKTETELYEQIGRLKMELECIGRKLKIFRICQANFVSKTLKFQAITCVVETQHHSKHKFCT